MLRHQRTSMINTRGPIVGNDIILFVALIANFVALALGGCLGLECFLCGTLLGRFGHYLVFGCGFVVGGVADRENLALICEEFLGGGVEGGLLFEADGC